MSNEMQEYELYKGKTFGGLCKDIVTNSEEKKQQLDVLMTDLREMIKDIKDAVMVIPLLKEYYDIGVRNDEQLIKLAAIVQRLVAGKMSSEGGDGNVLLTDEEKKQLMSSIESTAKAIDDKMTNLDKAKTNKSE